MVKLKLLNSHILIINTRKLIPREVKVRENKITTKTNLVSRKKRESL